MPIVIVHVSNRESMEEIDRARKRGAKVVGETCPQYLMLTADDLDREGWEGAKFVCSPPPRDEASKAACWAGLEQGIFDLYSSDHCPFRFDDAEGKLNSKGKTSFRWIPNGIPGVGTLLPILFSEGVMQGRVDLPQFVALTSTNHAKLYGLYPQKGTIAVGSGAGLTLWDPKESRTIRNADLHQGADYTPYEGLKLQGWPVTVILRGVVAVENGAPRLHTGAGRYLRRRRSPGGVQVPRTWCNFIAARRCNLGWPSRCMVEVEFGDFNHEPHGDPDDQDQHGPVRASGKSTIRATSCAPSPRPCCS